MRAPGRPAFILAAFLLLETATAAKDVAAAPAFAFPAETFSFSNDTVLAYGTDELGRFQAERKKEQSEFTHRCLVLVRATLQFHKFARFDPSAPKSTDEEYRSLVRHVSRIPTWFPTRPPARRVVIPGYASLYDFSRGRQHMMKEELGEWWPTYLRIGNHRIMVPMFRAGQASLARWLVRRLDDGEPSALFLVRFPKMNHAVVAYDYVREKNGDIRFDVYDPNYPGEPAWVRYQKAERSFEFMPRWYFPGGRVNALRLYISPFH